MYDVCYWSDSFFKLLIILLFYIPEEEMKENSIEVFKYLFSLLKYLLSLADLGSGS